MGYPTRFRCSLSGGIIMDTDDPIYITLQGGYDGVLYKKLFGGLHLASADEHRVYLDEEPINLYKRIGLVAYENIVESSRMFEHLEIGKNTHFKPRVALIKLSAIEIIFQKELRDVDAIIDEIYDDFRDCWAYESDNIRKMVEACEGDKSHKDLIRGLRMDLLLNRGPLNAIKYKKECLSDKRYILYESVRSHFQSILTPDPGDLYRVWPYPPSPTPEEIKRMYISELLRDYFTRINIFNHYAWTDSLPDGRTNQELIKKLTLTIKALRM